MARLDMLADMRNRINGESINGEVRLGVYPSAAAYLLPRVITLLRSRHPAISLVFFEGSHTSVDEPLSSGEVDLAIRPMLPLVADEGLGHTALWRESLVAVLPAGSSLEHPSGLDLYEVAEYQIILVGDTAGGVGGRNYETNMAFLELGLEPSIAFRTNQPQTLINLVAHGHGVGISNALAMTTANLDGVRLIPVRQTNWERRVALWWRLGQPASPAVEAVKEIVMAVPPPEWPWDNSTPSARNSTHVVPTADTARHQS